MATRKARAPLTAETMPWQAYDKMGLDESEAFLQEHPEARQLLYQRDMAAMNNRRMNQANRMA